MNALEIYNDNKSSRNSSIELKRFIEWMKLPPGENKDEIEDYLNKISTRYQESEDYENGIDFFYDFYNNLTSEILSSPIKSKKVLFRGLNLNAENYHYFLSQKEMRSDKFDSFTTCLEIAYLYSGAKNNIYDHYPVLLVTYFPKGSHIAKIGKREKYTLHERLTPPDNLYKIIDYETYQISNEEKVFPTTLTVVLMSLIEENDEKMKKITSFKSDQLDNLRRLLTKETKTNKKYFAINVKKLKFDNSDEEFERIIEKLNKKKNSLIFDKFEKLIYDDISRNCLHFLDRDGRYIYPNVIFEMDENLDLDLAFPSGYNLKLYVKNNKVGRNYYLIKISI